MFQSNDIFVKTIPAGEDLSSKQFHFVKLNAAGRVVACNTAGERAFGVVLNKPDAAGKSANVVTGPGGSFVVAGAAVPLGSEVATDAQGRAKVAAATEYVNGVAVSGAAAANARISANLLTYQKNA